MKVALGDMLRRARESKGLSIDQLSTITRLNSLFIEALEEGRWDRLPGQVYLKPFAKACAEALDLDLKEVYKAIEGEKAQPPREESSLRIALEEKRRFDYKLPLVIIIGAAIIGIIYMTVRHQQKTNSQRVDLRVVPAHVAPEKREIRWNRPWERPAAWQAEFPDADRLRLEATDTVWVSVLSGADTLFMGFMNSGDGKTFISKDKFTLNLGRNDCISGYLNGERIPAIGTSVTGLYNYRPRITGKETE